MTALWAVRAGLTDERRARRKSPLSGEWGTEAERALWAQWARRSVGNRKKRLRDYASFLD